MNFIDNIVKVFYITCAIYLDNDSKFHVKKKKKIINERETSQHTVAHKMFLPTLTDIAIITIKS